ncbi:hypothetical protein AVEN_200958-1 [Araneus ventricosus]|nr:hypothetical protein AVEN_58524-1 [Araneus ventricosus]GBO00491.1 hypothetical protein AVEN_109531-1 [Araneus ventricosus]GBO00494.1 hypothetical protein AVEN_200958-1 [Araneus ventricosus]
METLVRAENLVTAVLSKFWTAVEVTLVNISSGDFLRLVESMPRRVAALLRAKGGSFPRKEGNLILWYIMELHKIELFSPLGKPQVYFGIHSPFVPMNPVTEGHEIRIGYHYQFQVQLEKEERLLPPPYQTNCRDNGPSDDAENFTNPNSYEVCLEMCSSEISKHIYGCDYGMTMQLSANHLCHGDGIRRTKPCSSQLPSAGVFNRNAWRQQQALQWQGTRSLAFDTL